MFGSSSRDADTTTLPLLPHHPRLYEANPDIRKLVTDLLEEEGYAVMGTDSLREGEAVCSTVDLFLADCDETTKETAMAVFRRVCGAAGRDVPIVIFTANRIVKQ